MGEEQKKVINDFIRLTEKIANGKMNVLDFGSEDMTFYRGEIHTIKMVGDQPGIFISEIARSFNVTRAVIAKTVRKLVERGFMTKFEDDDDKKRLCLYLTEKGRLAYAFHDEYHRKYDRPLYEYLDQLSDDELQTIQTFLQHATQLINNHF